MTDLEQHINYFFGASSAELSAISSLFKPKVIAKGNYFLKTGQYSNQIAFLQSGILREYLHVNDKEVTKWIATKGSFILDLKSYVFNQPARWNIQALTDCNLLVLDTFDNKELNKSAPNWTEIEKIFIAKCFTFLEDRIVQHLSLSAEERYIQLFTYNAELFNQVPLQYLASMLGMTPETLSRIRKKTAEASS